jgi:hypothetical protein
MLAQCGKCDVNERTEKGQPVGLEHVPEKLTDFSDQNMLQEIDFERILIDRMIPSDRNTL